MMTLTEFLEREAARRAERRAEYERFIRALYGLPAAKETT